MNRPINLRKSRDFGQIISDSFAFLRENFKPLCRALLVICGLFMLFGTITTIAQYFSMAGLYRGVADINDNGSYQTDSNRYSYFVTVFLNLGTALLLQGFIHLTTLSYMSVYLHKEGSQPTLPEVWGYFKYYFLRTMGAGVLIVLMVIVGCVLCLIPGIYLSIVFYLLIPIIVMENTSFSYAFNKCFQLIRNNWWLVFGVIFVTSLIVGVLGAVANIPLEVIPLTAKFVTHKSLELPVIIFVSVLKNLLMLAYALPTIAIALCYFKLSEEKESTGLFGRIEQFGNTPDPGPDLPTEQY